MKRLFYITTLMLFVFYVNVRANNDSYIHLQVGIYDPYNTHGHKPKSPVVVPQILQNCNILILTQGCDNCLLELLPYDNDEDVVFYVFVASEDIVILPEDLSGKYKIRLTRDNIYFWGYIFI